MSIIFNFSSLASNIKNEFEKVRNNDLKNSKVFETKNFYFSQIIYEWEKGSNRKLLSRQGMLDSINQFKSFFIITSKSFKRKEINVSNKSKLKFKNRFWYYDVLFLDVLVDSKGKGSLVFSDLFRNNDPLLLFKFLGEKTNIFEEIRIFVSVNIMTFVKSLIKRVKSVYLKDFLRN